MRSKKQRLKNQLGKRLSTQLVKAKKQLNLVSQFDREGIESRTINAISKIRVCLDFLDRGKLKKKENRKLRNIDSRLLKAQRLVTGINAFEDSANKLKSLFNGSFKSDQNFKASVLDIAALEKRAVEAESMIQLNMLNVGEVLGELESMSKKGKLKWISKKEITFKIKALDTLLKQQQKDYDEAYKKVGPLSPQTIKLARKLSGGLNAAINSHALLYRVGIIGNMGKVRKYRRVEKRINAFLRLKDVNTFVRRFQSSYGALSNEDLDILLNISEGSINKGFSFKKGKKAVAESPVKKTEIKETPVKKTTTASTTTTKRRGRPKKTTTVAKTTTPVKKTTTASTTTTKRRGRPKKTTTVAKTTTPVKKTTTASTTTTKRRGRPKKTTTVAKTTTPVKKTTTASTTTTKRRGRPKKTTTIAKTTTPKTKTTRRRGRPRKIVPNDLTKIKGIGPALEKSLNSVGIVSYSQLASLSEADHAKIDAKVSRFHGRARRAAWAKEAELLMNAK